VFHFDVPQFVQIRLPAAVLREIIGHAFTNENVTGITAIPLRDDPRFQKIVADLAPKL